MTIGLSLFIYYQNITGAAFFPNTAIMMKPLSEVTGAGWKCQHDYFSYQALVLALTEFAVPKVSAAGMAGTRFLLLGKVATKLAAKEGFIGKVFKKIKPKAGWREEFKLEKNIIHVIYFQALLWFLQPFFPFGAVLGPILLFLDYKWEVCSSSDHHHHHRLRRLHRHRRQLRTAAACMHAAIPTSTTTSSL